MKVSEAGNTIIPAYYALIEKGYQVERVLKEPEDNITLWRATKGSLECNASNPITLLGVVAMAETRGEDWKLTQAEFKEFHEKYLSFEI